MQISNLGLIDILGHEGICLEPYLDSVGVWTIGAGITSDDGVRINAHTPHITLEQAIAQFKVKIKPYTDAVDAIHMQFNQAQYDALSSACYNFGPGNLRSLAHGRTISQIGDALMLYRKPPEITARRHLEQVLYKTGHYYNVHATTLLFPVTASHHPDYHRGHDVDLRPYFQDPVVASASPLNSPVTNPDIAD